MLTIEDRHDKDTFVMIVAFLSTVGAPTTLMLKFCDKYKIDTDKLSKELMENRDKTMANLRRLNQI